MITSEAKNWIIFIFPIISAGLDMGNLHILVAFLTLDIVTGVFADFRVNGLTNYGFKVVTFDVVWKTFIVLFPFIIKYIGIGAGKDLTLVANWALSALIVAIGLSILDNIITIKTGRNDTKLDIINKTLKKIREVLIAMLPK